MAAPVLVVYDPNTLVQHMVVLNATNPDDPAWNPPGLKHVRIPREHYDAKNAAELAKLLPPEVVPQVLSTKSAAELGLVSGNIEPQKQLTPEQQKQADDIASAMAKMLNDAERTALHVKLFSKDVETAKAEVIAARTDVDPAVIR